VHGQGSSLAAGQLNGPNLKREWSCMCFCVATLIFLVLLCFSVFAYAFLVELFHFFSFRCIVGVLCGALWDGDCESCGWSSGFVQDWFCWGNFRRINPSLWTFVSTRLPFTEYFSSQLGSLPMPSTLPAHLTCSLGSHIYSMSARQLRVLVSALFGVACSFPHKLRPLKCSQYNRSLIGS